MTHLSLHPPQLEFADQQLRELGKLPAPKATLKEPESFRQNPSDLSTDSLDLSLDEGQPLNSTRYGAALWPRAAPSPALPPSPTLSPRAPSCRKATRSHSDGSAVPDGAEPRTSQRLPRKVESLESLYFTPIASRTQPKLESSTGSLGDVSLESGCRTRSGRRRTTQIINITMTKVSGAEPNAGLGVCCITSLFPSSFCQKETATEEPGGADASFSSILSEQPQKAAPARSRLRSARSLASFSSQDSLTKLDTSSPQEPSGHAALLSLPGYRPATRSALRRSQAGSSSSLGEWGRLGAELYPGLNAGLPLSNSPHFAFRSQQHLLGDVSG